MNDILTHPAFRTAYARLAGVGMNPRRHTAPNVQAHSAAAADLAARLGRANACSAEEVRRLETLGHIHDIGKITGSARPEHSLEVLRDCGALEPALLALVRWHDLSLPWYRSAQRGETPSERAWARLARDVDLRLLCMFMVADRVDAPGGWRRSLPTVWFIDEVRRRGLVGELVLDLPDHPSLISAGGALVRGGELLLIRVRAQGWELPKGGLEWDETAEQAALREMREEAGVSGRMRAVRSLGELDYFVDQAGRRLLKRVRYFELASDGPLEELRLPPRTRERLWAGRDRLGSLPLVNEGLRPLLLGAAPRR